MRDPSQAQADSVVAEDESNGGGRIPWTRALLLLAIAGPALWLGGVKPWVVPVFALVVAGLLARRCIRTDAPLRVPAFAWIGLMLTAVTLLQWLPLPSGIVATFAPGLHALVAELTARTSVAPWNRLSVDPSQTGLELARVLALTGLFVASAQLSWRLVAAYVAATGTVVAVIGLVHKLAGATAIYGLYRPRQPLSGIGQQLGSPLLTSFINPNHQSGLLLVGGFAAAAMAVDLGIRARETRGRGSTQRLADRAYVAWGALAIQATALVLSMSRAALLAGLIVAPIALVIGLRTPKPVGSEPTGRGRRLGLGVLTLAMLALAASQGAFGQLLTLGDPESFAAKLRVTGEGFRLLGLSPILGIGRGCFVDLFPLVDSAPGRVVFTHLESTPIAVLVEWGLAGLIALIGVGLWWWTSFRASSSVGRRLALCGLLALAIQSGADFSLDYLGVAAPAVALAGAVGANRAASGWACRSVLGATIVGLLIAEAIAIPAIPASWSARRARDQAVLAGERSADDALADTPLDPFIHLALAREHAAAHDWLAASERAEAAARLRPASIDAHLLAAVAAAELGVDASEHVQLGLEALREPVPEPLSGWLLARFPKPESLAAIAPDDPLAWTALTRAIVAEAPAHARALASARTLSHPDDPEPLRIQAELAFASQSYGLALHHARLLAALRPNEARSHKLRFDARVALGTPAQLAAAVTELELARESTKLDDPAVVDELLVTALLRVGDPAALDRAEPLLDALLAQRAKPEVRRRREALAERVRGQARSRP